MKNCENSMSYTFPVEADAFLRETQYQLAVCSKLRNVLLSIQITQASKLATSIVLNFGKFCFGNKT